MVTPGFSLATMVVVLPQLSVASEMGQGRRKATASVGVKTDEKSNVSGRTPTTVTGSSFSDRVRPATVGSAPKRRVQKPCVRMMARGPPSWSTKPPQWLSSSVKFRPTTGFTPRTSRKLAVTFTPTRRAGSPSPLRL